VNIAILLWRWGTDSHLGGRLDQLGESLDSASSLLDHDSNIVVVMILNISWTCPSPPRVRVRRSGLASTSNLSIAALSSTCQCPSILCPSSVSPPVACAHVLTLKVPPSDKVKRFITSSSTFTWIEAVEFLVQAGPELKGRLPTITGNEPPVKLFATLDTSTTESILGLKGDIKW